MENQEKYVRCWDRGRNFNHIPSEWLYYVGQGQEWLNEVTTRNEDVGETDRRKGEILAGTSTEDVIGNCSESTLYSLPIGRHDPGMSRRTWLILWGLKGVTTRPLQTTTMMMMMMMMMTTTLLLRTSHVSVELTWSFWFVFNRKPRQL
jgi:hypothetical protein